MAAAFTGQWEEIARQVNSGRISVEVGMDARRAIAEDLLEEIAGDSSVYAEARKPDQFGVSLVDRIRNQIGDIASATATLRVLEEELRSRLAEAPSGGLDLVQHTGGRLEVSHGAVPVGALADAAGVSGNHLATQFKSHVGITPKRLARIYRFARLILSVDALRPIDWSELAQTAGYFDRAHFSREFKDFTGHTPTGYLALRRRFPAEQGFPPDSGPMPAD